MAVLLDFFFNHLFVWRLFSQFQPNIAKKSEKKIPEKILFLRQNFLGDDTAGPTLMFLYTETEHHLFTHQTQHLVHINFIKKKSSLFHFALIITNSVIKNN